MQCDLVGSSYIFNAAICCEFHEYPVSFSSMGRWIPNYGRIARNVLERKKRRNAANGKEELSDDCPSTDGCLKETGFSIRFRWTKQCTAPSLDPNERVIFSEHPLTGRIGVLIIGLELAAARRGSVVLVAADGELCGINFRMVGDALEEAWEAFNAMQRLTVGWEQTNTSVAS